MAVRRLFSLMSVDSLRPVLLRVLVSLSRSYPAWCLASILVLSPLGPLGSWKGVTSSSPAFAVLQTFLIRWSCLWSVSQILL